VAESRTLARPPPSSFGIVAAADRLLLARHDSSMGCDGRRLRGPTLHLSLAVGRAGLDASLLRSLVSSTRPLPLPRRLTRRLAPSSDGSPSYFGRLGRPQVVPSSPFGLPHSFLSTVPIYAPICHHHGLPLQIPSLWLSSRLRRSAAWIWF
jgi:hypothetical protein